MSLKSVGVYGTIYASILSTSSEGQFKTNDYVSSKYKESFLDAEKQLFRNLFEAYLNSEQFKKDVYQLGSIIDIKIDRSVDLVMPNEG